MKIMNNNLSYTECLCLFHYWKSQLKKIKPHLKWKDTGSEVTKTKKKWIKILQFYVKAERKWINYLLLFLTLFPALLSLFLCLFLSPCQFCFGLILRDFAKLFRSFHLVSYNDIWLVFVISISLSLYIHMYTYIHKNFL
jgi:hypothetical protein